MRPDAPAFSPFAAPVDKKPAIMASPSPSPSVQSVAAPTRALVRASTPRHVNAPSPMDLIKEETLRTLVLEATQLRERCETLEQENQQLKTKVGLLKTAQRTPFREVGAKAKLTSYSSSNTSAEDIFEPHYAPHGSDRTARIEQHLHILQDRVEKLDNGLEPKEGAPPAISASTDIQMAGFAAKLNSHCDKHLTGIEMRLEAKLAAMNKDIGDIQKTTNVAFSKVGEMWQTLEHNDPSKATASQLQALSSEMVQLKKAFASYVREGRKRREYEELIDGAFTQEALHLMYHQLGYAAFDEDLGGRCGPFQGTEDDLFALRERVLARLAIFSSLGEVQKKAQNVDLDALDVENTIPRPGRAAVRTQ